MVKRIPVPDPMELLGERGIGIPDPLGIFGDSTFGNSSGRRSEGHKGPYLSQVARTVKRISMRAHMCGEELRNLAENLDVLAGWVNDDRSLFPVSAEADLRAAQAEFREISDHIERVRQEYGLNEFRALTPDHTRWRRKA
jgi:hypothetical protein